MLETRLKPCRAGSILDLTDAELQHYSGSGIALLRVESGNVVEMIYGNSLEDSSGLTNWINENFGREMWLGYCSSTQVVNPRRIRFEAPTELAADLAHVARRMFNADEHY